VGESDCGDVAKTRLRDHIGSMSTKSIVTCACGAEYERTEEKVIFRDKDSFECHRCGKTLESWNGSRIPLFKLIKEPEAPTNDQESKRR
jgi:transposase-like protein